MDCAKLRCSGAFALKSAGLIGFCEFAALAISKLMDGIVMVVRDSVSDQHMLAEAMRQLELVDARVLGFAYRDCDGVEKKYSSRYRKKYYKYYNRYGNDYEKSK